MTQRATSNLIGTPPERPGVLPPGLLANTGYGITSMNATPSKLRELACWYRDFAEKSGNPVIWEARLHTAQQLETEADQIERHQSVRSNTSIPIETESRS
jgi:hypothetical protein